MLRHEQILHELVIGQDAAVRLVSDAIIRARSGSYGGRLTEAQGRTVDFRNTILIMTSNVGSDLPLEGVMPEGEINPDTREAVLRALQMHFRPEFLNRVNDIVLFNPLTEAEIEQVVDLMFQRPA
jgi:ATP-dependent Clp protease ATP-binding subunit ClpA